MALTGFRRWVGAWVSEWVGEWVGELVSEWVSEWVSGVTPGFRRFTHVDEKNSEVKGIKQRLPGTVFGGDKNIIIGSDRR